MKFQNLLKLFFLILFLQSCEPTVVQQDCHTLGSLSTQKVLSMEGDTALDFVLSPLERNEVYVRFSNREWLELDIATGEQKVPPISPVNRFVFSQAPFFKDLIDSVVWVGDFNRKLLAYDLRTKLVEELEVNRVRQIYPSAKKVYFAGAEGLFYWDRVWKVLKKVEDLPIENIKWSNRLDERILILEGNHGSYTYNIETEDIKKEIHLYGFSLSGEEKGRTYKCKEGIAIFKKDEAIHYSTQEGIETLPEAYNIRQQNMEIVYPYIWGVGKTHFHRYNVETKEYKEFPYLIPRKKNYSLSFTFKKEEAWIQSPEHLFFLKANTGTLHKLPTEKEDGFRKAIIDDCNVYLLYQQQLIVESKSDFMNRCPVFEQTKYEKELADYQHFLDSLRVRKDTDEKVALEKLRFLQQKYRDATEHTDIQKSLKTLERGIFNSVSYDFPEDYEACFENTAMPLAQRKSCITHLLYQYGQQADFEKVFYFYPKYEELLDKSPDKDYNQFSQAVEQVKNYYHKIDSLEELYLPQESLMFAKALALEQVCQTVWFCHQGCGGCDFSMVIKELKSFLATYPESHLVDDAAFHLLRFEWMYLHEDSKNMALAYEDFLKKYPNTNLASDVEYYILTSMSYVNPVDTFALKKKTDTFLANYPNYPHIKIVENISNRIKN